MAMKNHPLKPLWFPSHGHNGRSDLPKLEPQWGQIKCQWGRKQVKMYTIAACRALKITTPKSVFSYIFPVLYAIAPPKKENTMFTTLQSTSYNSRRLIQLQSAAHRFDWRFAGTHEVKCMCTGSPHKVNRWNLVGYDIPIQLLQPNTHVMLG